MSKKVRSFLVVVLVWGTFLANVAFARYRASGT